MKPRNLEKIIRGLRIPILILITALIFSGCGSSNENREISKDNVPEIIDLSKEDAILESRTHIGPGWINIVLIRGHEYAIFSSRADELESSALWGTHLTETCVGCRDNNVEIDTITISHHKFMITKIKYKNGRYGIGAKHLEPAPKEIGGCDYCWNQKEK